MNRLNSINYSALAFNVSMLVLRLAFGGLLLSHGIGKLQNFNIIQEHFYNFLGMGTKATLILAIFAEVFCSLFVMIGLFTRLSVLPIIITMLVAIFGAYAGKPFLEAELPMLYLFAFLVILMCGPGKGSIDGMMNK